MTGRRGIVGAGNWILDTVKTIDRWPPEGELAQILSVDRAGGGGPCNVLFDLAALGTDLPLWGAGSLGDDANGAWLQNELAARKIDAAYMRRVSGTETSFTDVMSVGGKRTFFHRGGGNDRFDIADLDAIDVPAKIVYLGYLLLLPGLDAPDAEFGTRAARGLANLRKRGYLTAVDLVSGSPEKFMSVVPPSLPHTDIFVINEIEAGYLLGAAIRRADGSLDDGLLRQAAGKLLELGVRELAAIHFPEGSVAVARSGEYCEMASCDVAKSEIVGTNGAGDAFFAGLLYAYHEGKSLPDMLRYASASARFNLRHPTANLGAPTLAEIEAYIASPGFPVPR